MFYNGSLRVDKLAKSVMVSIVTRKCSTLSGRKLHEKNANCLNFYTIKRYASVLLVEFLSKVFPFLPDAERTRGGCVPESYWVNNTLNAQEHLEQMCISYE